ncbi:MAG: hypothetical protein KIT22_14015 [Verrucomicrobiae bacterium]|nr:hypothetical protein [Verrucomicrobiae bacterium]
MNPLAVRKQLLLLEAELLRRQIAEDWSTAVGQIETGRRQARTFGSLASKAALGWTVFSLLFPAKQNLSPRRRAWTGVLWRGVRLAMTLAPAWKAFARR